MRVVIIKEITALPMNIWVVPVLLLVQSLGTQLFVKRVLHKRMLIMLVPVHPLPGMGEITVMQTPRTVV